MVKANDGFERFVFNRFAFSFRGNEGSDGNGNWPRFSDGDDAMNVQHRESGT